MIESYLGAEATRLMLSIENLDLFYGDAQALAGVSLEVPRGDIVAIVGANGAGKTSLIRAIAGMLKPARGVIRFKDRDIAGLTSAKVCDLGIGQVAEGRQIFPTLSVRENLLTGSLLPRARVRRAAESRTHVRVVPAPRRALRRKQRVRCPAASSRCSRSRAA